MHSQDFMLTSRNISLRTPGWRAVLVYEICISAGKEEIKSLFHIPFHPDIF